jgi:Tfp pilus assembly protein PilF
LPEALRSVGWGELIQFYNWAEAEKLLARALTLDPENGDALHWQSHILSWQGKHDQAIALARRAVMADPGSRLLHSNLGYILMDAGEFKASMEVHRQVFQTNPGYTGGIRNLWMAAYRAGDFEAGNRQLIIWAQKTNRDTKAARSVGEQILQHQRTGEPIEINMQAFDRVQFGTQSEAQVFALLGNREATIAALGKAWTERSGSRSVLSMKINPLYDFIRTDPRFIELLEKTGLTD